MSNDDIFDPSELETVEPLPPEHTEESAFIPDTNGDPEGSEARAEKQAIALPDFFFKRYSLDDEGKPIFNPSVVNSIMAVFDMKADSQISFGGDKAADEEIYYDSQVNTIVDGLNQLLEVDPQSTGIQFLSLNTRTWAEFVSIAYEYNDSLTSISANDDLPEWLIQREEKMMQLGRKARMLRDAIDAIDDKFGLKSTSLDRDRVQNEVERRLQRLAEWNFRKHADQSGKVANTYNAQTVQHCETVFANA
jgi:hypothetical protein